MYTSICPVIAAEQQRKCSFTLRFVEYDLFSPPHNYLQCLLLSDSYDYKMSMLVSKTPSLISVCGIAIVIHSLSNFKSCKFKLAARVLNKKLKNKTESIFHPKFGSSMVRFSLLLFYLNPEFFLVLISQSTCILNLAAYLCTHSIGSSVNELLCRSASYGIEHLMSTWTVLFHWHAARRELGCMNPLILELLHLFAV